MKMLRASALLVIACVSSSLLSAQRTEPPIIVDDGYILALSTADQFLHAWARRDADEGLALLTPTAIQRSSRGALTTMFQGVSSPHHESYEIGPGHKLSSNQYAFDVIQYAYLANMNAHDPRPTPSRLVVVEVAPGKWLVDAFPES